MRPRIRGQTVAHRLQQRPQPSHRRRGGCAPDNNAENHTDLGRHGPSDPLTGYVNADNIETLGKDELGDYLGEVTPATMNKINTALATALGLPWP